MAQTVNNTNVMGECHSHSSTFRPKSPPFHHHHPFFKPPNTTLSLSLGFHILSHRRLISPAPAKTGSLCCVAARPHGLAATGGGGGGSGDWSSLGRNEPFWRTNTSFSPPPISTRWDHRFYSDGPLSFGGGGACRDAGSSPSSKESRSWGVRVDRLVSSHYSASEDGVSYASSPSDSFRIQRLMPLPAADEYGGEPASETRTISLSVEGTSGVSHSVGSVSSRSDSSEYEHSRIHGSSHRTFSSRCSFISKPIHPLSLPDYSAEGDESHDSLSTPNSKNTLHPDPKSIRALNEMGSPVWLDLGGATRRGTSQGSSPSSMDFTDASEQLQPDCLGYSYNNLYEGSKCGVCDMFLSHRSPWGARRIVLSGDMPVVSVLSCWHVYHAECLEKATSKMHKHDPLCPLCDKSEDNPAEQRAACRLKIGPPRLKSLGEEGPSRPWSCVKAQDCVEEALQAPKPSSVSLHSRSCSRGICQVKGLGE